MQQEDLAVRMVVGEASSRPPPGGRKAATMRPLWDLTCFRPRPNPPRDTEGRGARGRGAGGALKIPIGQRAAVSAGVGGSMPGRTNIGLAKIYIRSRSGTRASGTLQCRLLRGAAVPIWWCHETGGKDRSTAWELAGKVEG